MAAEKPAATESGSGPSDRRRTRAGSRPWHWGARRHRKAAAVGGGAAGTGASADLEPSWSDAQAAMQAKVVKLYRSSLSYVDFVVPKIRMLSQEVPSSIMVKS